MQTYCLFNTRVEQDTFKNGESAGELLYFKRLRMDGRVEADGVNAKFELVLDLRARILSIGLKGPSPVPPAQIAESVFTEVARYVLGSIGRDIRVLASDAKRVEYIVRDADHVSGLLHRVQERGDFTAHDVHHWPPWPLPLEYMLEDILAVVCTNLEMINELVKTVDGQNSLPTAARFDTVLWEIKRGHFLELCGHDTLSVRVVSFFEQLKALAELTDRLAEGDIVVTRNSIWRKQIDEPSPHQGTVIRARDFYAMADWRRTMENTRQLGITLVRDFGSSEQRKRLGFEA